MAKIQEIKDNQNVLVYPLTHEKAVRDSGGNKLSDKLEDLSIFTYADVALAQELTGNRIESNGSITDGGYTTVTVYKYAVTGGEKYAFSGRMTATFTLYFLFWYDANGNFISREPYKGSSSAAVSYTRQIVTAPINAAFAMMNVNVSQKSYYKFESLEQVKTQDFYDDAVLKENIVDSLDSTATDQPLSANQGKALKEYIDGKQFEETPAMTYKELPIYATLDDTGIFGPDDVRTTTLWVVKQYEVVAGNDYYLCGYMTATMTLYFLYWYNANDEYISREPYKGSSSETFISFQKVTAPEGAAYAKVNIRATFQTRTALYSGTEISRQDEYDMQEKVNTLLGVSSGTIRLMPLYINSSGKFEDHLIYRHAVITVSPGEKYKMMNGGAGNALRYAFATTDVATAGASVPVVSGTSAASISTAGTTVTIPEGCSYLLVNYADYNLEGQATFDVTKVIEGGSSPTPTPTAEKRKLRLVCIGNSYSQDALAYVPFIMQAMGIDVDVTIGILMMSSSTLSDHISNFENETAAYTYYHYEAGATAWENQGKKTIQYALETYQWDIILTHSAGAGETNKNVYMPKVHRIVNDLYTDLAYPVKLGWVSGQTRPAVTNGGANRTDEVIMNYYNILQGQSQNVLQESVFDFNIPVGTAVQNARTIPTLKAIGGYASNENNTSGNGYLCHTDGVHLQEGLPCQLAAYTVILTLLDLLGINEKSIFGDTTRVTSSWTSSKSIPSPHGSCTGSTDDNCRMAQMCALMAHKNQFEVTDMTDIVNTNYE